MYVHQVVHNPTLYVPFVLVNDHLLSGIVYLHEAVFRLQALVQRLVLLLVMFYPEHEII